jgi:hypothetical protein
MVPRSLIKTTALSISPDKTTDQTKKLTRNNIPKKTINLLGPAGWRGSGQ